MYLKVVATVIVDVVNVFVHASVFVLLLLLLLLLLLVVVVVVVAVVICKLTISFSTTVQCFAF